MTNWFFDSRTVLSAFFLGKGVVNQNIYSPNIPKLDPKACVIGQATLTMSADGRLRFSWSHIFMTLDVFILLHLH